MKAKITISVVVALFSIASFALLSPDTATGSDRKGSDKMGSSKIESKAYLHSYNLPSSGIALEGYCPVAYIEANKAIRGIPEHASTYNDVIYHFVSADAKKLFDKNQEKYLPAYGGWCAYGMAVNDKFPVDPTNFKVVDGKLMLFLKNKNVDALEIWNNGDEKNLIKKADAYWKKVSK